MAIDRSELYMKSNTHGNIVVGFHEFRFFLVLPRVILIDI